MMENRIQTELGSIHTHFVHSISNSMVDHFDIDSINALMFCTGLLFDDENVMCSSSNMIIMPHTSNKVQFRHQATKNKCIESTS